MSPDVIRMLLARLRRRPCPDCRPPGAVASYERWRAAQPDHVFTDDSTRRAS